MNFQIATEGHENNKLQKMAVVMNNNPIFNRSTGGVSPHEVEKAVKEFAAVISALGSGQLPNLRVVAEMDLGGAAATKTGNTPGTGPTAP